MYDVTRGEVLLEKNADDLRPIASLTKLMTAMVVLDKAQEMGDTLTINEADIDRIKHSGSRIPVGTSLEREAMLRLALMSSENRAASALSRSFPGGQSAFIEQMNLKARGLNMSDTHFEDPTGLSPNNASTARDVVKLAIEAVALSDDQFIYHADSIRTDNWQPDAFLSQHGSGCPLDGLGRSARQNRIHARGGSLHRGRRRDVERPSDHCAAWRAFIRCPLR
ncbi:hypothetical protein PTKU46_84200 [Paraburkholderia terrae]